MQTLSLATRLRRLLGPIYWLEGGVGKVSEALERGVEIAEGDIASVNLKKR